MLQALYTELAKKDIAGADELYGKVCVCVYVRDMYVCVDVCMHTYVRWKKEIPVVKDLYGKVCVYVCMYMYARTRTHMSYKIETCMRRQIILEVEDACADKSYWK